MSDLSAAPNLDSRDDRKLIDEHLECAELCSGREDQAGAVGHYQAILALWEPAPGQSPESLAAIRELVRPVRHVCDDKVGEYYREIGYLDLALHHLKRSVEFAPGRWQSYVALGRTYFARGDFRDAQGFFQETQRLVHSEPGGLTQAGELASAAAYEHISEILLRHRSDGEALAPYFEQALELYEKAGDVPAAARCRLRLREGWGGRLDPEEVMERAQGLDQETALLALELASRQHPQHAELALRLGKALAAGGKDRQAGPCFLRVTQLEAPDLHGPAYESAADAFQRLKVIPEEVNRLYQRAAQAYAETGQKEAASRCCHKVS